MKKTLVDINDLITKTEAGRLRGVTAPAIHYLVQTGRLRSVEICGTIYVFRSEVLAYKPGSRQRVRKMSDDEVIEEVVRVATLIGHLPSSFEYKSHGRIHLSTLCRRFGGWSKVRQAAFARMKGRA